MESSNMLDLHHHAEELFFLHASTTPVWNQDPLLNGIELIPSISRTALSSSRDEQHVIDPASFTSSHHMVHDLGLQWSSRSQHSTQQIHLAKIKEEHSLESFLKLEQHQLSSAVKHEERTELHDLSSYQPSPPPLAHGNLGFDPLGFGMVLPSLNVQSTYLPSLETSIALDVEALDILASARIGRIAPCEFSNTTFVDSMYYGLPHQLHFPAHGGFINIQEIPPSLNGLTEGKRANCSGMDHLKPAKKPRFDSRPSLPPFKVRKEKLGDRIAALQQLVAPFGKTDTASVLMEAIGYIKFLQDQVETLSVPYMRPSSNKKLSTTEEASTINERDDSKPDLRSRGLCLVPLSCTSYVTNDNAVWSPPNFR
uniref:Transcription factor bHLH110 isoform X1 n=1 Tax=Cymbidium ensifolium TaxID=78740 RepID=A0A515HG47_CYMEN|nr:transcription factor bHLH110 isoform X1 [Cymbidium ensifolium]